jgi:putative transposase
MVYDSGKYDRRSIRLRGYDYATTNPYFVTICAHQGASLFGEVIDPEMHLNLAGQMAEKWWNKLAEKFPRTLTDSVRIMPNHLHAIFVIVGSGLDVVPRFGIGLEELDLDGAEENDGMVRSLKYERVSEGGHVGPPLPSGNVPGKLSGRARPTLGQMIQWFKTMTTNEYIREVKNSAWPSFAGKLWQRNYYEHIVRNEVSLNRIREYISDNPVRWHLDRENPCRTGSDEFDEWLEDM